MLLRLLLLRRKNGFWIGVVFVALLIISVRNGVFNRQDGFVLDSTSSLSLIPPPTTSLPKSEDLFQSFFVWTKEELRARPAAEHSPTKGSTVQCKTEKKGPDFVVECPFPKRTNRARMFDFFLYNGEQTMLEMRLATLDSVVDYFIVVEGEETFSGRKKPAFFRELIVSRNYSFPLDKFAKRFIYVSVPTLVTNQPFDREALARATLLKRLEELGIGEDDILILADIDEIPRPEVVDYVASHAFVSNAMIRIEVFFSYFTFFWENKQLPWEIRMIKAGFVANARDPSIIHHARRSTKVDVNFSGKGGWHCSFCLSLDEVVRKVMAYSHVEHANPTFLEQSRLKHKIENGLDPFDRNIKYTKVCPDDLPYFYSRHPERAARPEFSHLVSDRSMCGLAS